MHYQVLGPLRASVDGEPVNLGGPKQRLVLALLLIEAGRTVSADRLIDWVWDESPPERARHTLQAYISELRKSLKDPIEWTGNAYRLLVDQDDIDSVRFENLLNAGRQELESDPGQAALILNDTYILIWTPGSVALFLTAKCIDGSITVMHEKKAAKRYRSELRAEQVDATRQRIIEAAVAGFAPWAASLPFDKVAERARVSERTVYRHFPTQRDLLQAVTAHIVARSGWEPDELNAENLGPKTAGAFTYFGTLMESGEHQPESQSPEMKALRAKRLETIERIVAPYTEGMDPELARGICAVFAELVRVQVFRGMYEQWGLSGAEAGRAVEWAITALFNELHRKEEEWNTTKASPPTIQAAP